MPRICPKEEGVNTKPLFPGNSYLDSSRLLYKEATPEDLENRELQRSYLVYEPLIYSADYFSVYTTHHLNPENAVVRPA